MYEGLYDNDKLNVAVDMEAMTMAIKRDGLLDDDYFADIKAKDDLDPGLKTKPDFDSVPDAAASAYEAVKDTLVSEAEAVSAAAHEAVTEAEAVAENAKSKISGTAEAVVENTGDAIENSAENVAQNVAQIAESVDDSAKDLFKAAKEAVENDFAGIKEAVPAAADKTDDILFNSDRKINLTLEPAINTDAEDNK